MKERVLKPTAADNAFRDDAIALLKKHAGHLSAEVMLALSSHLVGQIIAMQDQKTMTKDRALQIVMRNMEVGNSEVLDKLTEGQGNG